MKPYESLWDASIDELKKGYRWDSQNKAFACLICGTSFVKGEIFPLGDQFFDAEKRAELHVLHEHGSMFHVLLELDKKHSGITEQQKKILTLFYEGYNDKLISEQIGGSTSTIRNHRFNLKEKERQAKVFLTLMELLKDQTGTVTKEEEKTKQSGLNRYFSDGIDGTLKRFPTKEKDRIMLLNYLIKKFDPERQYSEKEINDILKAIYPDYALIRRYFVDYGLMERTLDGSAYWVKGGNRNTMEKERRSQVKREYKETKREMGIIQIKNVTNGKVYLESSRNLDAVFNKNRFLLNQGVHRNSKLQKDWNDYGADQFLLEVLEKVEHTELLPDQDDAKELKALEQKWLNKLQPFGEQGYH
ncbi:DUF2087 domain-containing protein [Heliorestis acidaminivorans]|uniref:DUF2087 domain-containing protein n=1 Tax=Heliorestis acidaminivorans TaxID=553427 RepID=A0A6I0F5I1_9FIRM|nr:DUF2087 domain-containing protein [Heliorestis acidaminivorans]KAB2954252.1 DUF2087 domain-containing protein [Heliorestis acidaminivorans]